MAEKFIYGAFTTIEETKERIDVALQNAVTTKDITIVGTNEDEFKKNIEDHYDELNFITFDELREEQADDADSNKHYKEYDNVDHEDIVNNNGYLVLIDEEFFAQLP